MPKPRTVRPTRAELQAAADRTVPDVIAPGLRVLFCGINPSLYTAAVGHHFARPGNRFWPALHAGGFTPRQLRPEEEAQLLEHGCGITNVVARATASASELRRDDYVQGGRALRRRVQHYAPRCLAVLGIGAYRVAFERPQAALGPQPERLGDTALWVLPNPSGANAHHRPEDFARLFRELRLAMGA